MGGWIEKPFLLGAWPALTPTSGANDLVLSIFQCLLMILINLYGVPLSLCQGIRDSFPSVPDSLQLVVGTFHGLTTHLNQMVSGFN